MAPHPVSVILKTLSQYYADREGNERQLNPVQVVLYRESLAKYSPQALEEAARTWIRKSKFFPSVSDLLEILESSGDDSPAAQLAWLTVERAIRSAGAYRGVRFEQGAIGEAVRQVFGNWPVACSFDVDSPGWAIRRQSFLAIFPTLMRQGHPSVALPGRHKDVAPYVVPAVEGIPAQAVISAPGDPGGPTTHLEAVEALARLAERRKP